MALVIDGVLRESALRRASTPQELAVAAQLAGSVASLVVSPGRAHGTVPDRTRRSVTLTWSAGTLRAECACDGSRTDRSGTVLCRHAVAVGLATLAQARRELPRGTPRSRVEQWLASLDVTALQDLVVERAGFSSRGQRLLETSATVAAGATHEVERQLLASVTAVLGDERSTSFGEGWDHSDFWGDSWHDEDDSASASSDVAEGIGVVLDELEGHLAHGRADLTLAPLRLTCDRLATIRETADDLTGALSEAADRAIALYARACREGHPDPVDLAQWLADHRDRQVPATIVLADVVSTFDAPALAAYRARVVELDAVAQVEHQGWGRPATELMLLELADHDGDVDAAVEVLSRGEHPRDGDIVARLDHAGRHDEAVQAIDRAVASGQLSLRTPWDQPGVTMLDPQDVAERYLRLGRVDDAIAMLRRLFERDLGDASYQLLLGFAARVDAVEAQRSWALERARAAATKRRDGRVLIDLLLVDGDVEGAWAVVDELGPGHAWEALARASAASHPARAAELYRPLLASLLPQVSTGVYPQVATTLRTMRELYAAAGSRAAFDDEIRAMRVTYKRRTSMMKAFDKAGLPKA